MENLHDSFDNPSQTYGRAVSKEGPSTELNVINAETNIERLITELNGSIPRQISSSITRDCVSIDCITHSEESVVLTDPTNIDEILSVDELSIPASSHNVSILNVACQQVLKQMEYQLLTLLKKNRKEQEIIQNYLSTNFKSSSFETTKRPSLICAGMPYFKDNYGFQPPPNNDVLRKHQNNKLLPVDFIKTYPIWSNTDAKKLVSAIKQFDVAKPSTIDWLKISVTDMQGKYSASECKAKWLMHLNPSINRSKWSMKEMENLKKLSAKYNYQNWDKVAAELGTGRNGLQCCVQYRTHTPPTVGKWTKEEDEILKKLVEKYKVKDCIPWKKVAWHFEDRSLRQCQERYAYHLGNIRKGNFTMEEDFVIVYLASKLKNFGEVAKFLPDRVSTQVRARYEYLVEISMPKFSKEEDELLSKLMAKYPRNWGKISEHFKNRSRIQCRRRWGCLQKKIQLVVGSEVENDEFGDFISEIGTIGTRTGTDRNQIDTENVKKHMLFLSKHTKEDKKYPEVYRKLLDYHKNCYKFLYGPKPRIPSNSEDIRKLTVKMTVTMKNLSVSHAGPSNDFNIDTLSNNCEFDKEDIVVLKTLKISERPSTGFELSTRIIPPNYMTLLALRTFTLGWNSIQNLCNFHTENPPETREIDPNDRILCSDAKKLFKTRLKTIFAFPLILSNISITEIQKPILKAKVRKVAKPLSKRKRKEHAKLMSAAYRNKLKSLVGKFQDSDVPSLPQKNEQVESNKSKGRKSKNASKDTKNPKNREENTDVNESKKGGMSGSKNSKINEENCYVSKTRKRTRSVKTESNEFLTPFKKRASYKCIKGERNE